MARTLYNLLLCATLVLLATLWMRPGLAQDILDFARSVRFQSPGVAAASPQATDFNTPIPGYSGQPGSVPYSNLPGAPVQPMPATRPASWPGAPLDYGTPSQPVNAVPQSAAPMYQQSTAPAYPQSGAPMYQQPAAPMYPPANGMAQQSAIAQQSVAAPQYGMPPQAGAMQQAGQYPGYAPPQMAAQLGAQYPSASPQTGYIPPQGQMGAVQQGVAPPIQGLPQDASQMQPPISVAMIPQANADMQSLQVLPGPRQDYEDGRIVATVGTLPILAGDVRAMINHAIQSKMITAPPPGQEKELYEAALRPVLKQMVEMKMVVNDAKQTIPAAAFPKIEAEVNRDFDKNQIPSLMKEYHVEDQHALDDALRQAGSSLDWERHMFLDQNIFMGWRNQQVKDEKQDVPLADVLGYYEQHLLDYEFPAKAKWEELMVSFDRFPDKAAAYAAIAQMGNQVMQGTPFAEVAKKMSQGPTADEGGTYDWTTQGSLASKALDENLFQLPVGSLSAIIESDRGFHIIRVVERNAAGKKSFEDAQGDIKKQLKEEGRKKQIEKYMTELHKKTPVHSIFDDQPGGLDGPPKVAEHNF